MRQSYWELRALGIDVVGAANDTPETNKELRERLDLPFPILSDTDGEVAKAYGAFHENEPQGRKIALVSHFLISQADDGGHGTIIWEYVGPSSRYRVAPSRLSEEVQRALGRTELIVSVVVPSMAQLESTVAELQDPPLGIYTTPEHVPERVVLTQRDYIRELAMQSHSEVQRLTEAGWTLVAVVPEQHGDTNVGQRWVFRTSTSR